MKIQRKAKEIEGREQNMYLLWRPLKVGMNIFVLELGTDRKVMWEFKEEYHSKREGF